MLGGAIPHGTRKAEKQSQWQWKWQKHCCVNGKLTHDEWTYIFPSVSVSVRLFANKKPGEVVEAQARWQVVYAPVAGMPLPVPMGGIPGGLQLLRNGGPAEVDVVGGNI